MPTAQDYLTGEDGDLIIEHGDFVFGPSDDMHVQDILTSTPGTWHESPLVGVGIKSMIEADYTRATLDALDKKVRLQLEMDGFRVEDVEILLSGNDIQQINIDAER